MSEINLFNRWTVKKKVFWWSLGGGVILLLLFGCVLTFLFGTMGGVGGADYRAYAPSYDGGFVYAEEPAMGAAPGEAIFLEAEADYAADEVYAAEQSVVSNTAAVPTERLIIREGNISIEVEDPRATRDQIDGIVSALADKGAFVVSSSESGQYENALPYISMTIRVPVEDFDMVMDQLADMGIEINDRNESAQDVTEEFVDLQSRIESMEAARDRLLEIMLDADTTEDLLYAEQQLTIRETEIEALKARLLYLTEAARLSRIYISITPYILSQPYDDSWKPLETIREAIESLIYSFQGFIDFLIVFIIAVLPWFVLFGLVIWLVVRFFRNRKAKKEAKTESA